MHARSQEKLQESLRQVQDLLERQRVLEELTHKQATDKRDLLESLVHRQNLAEIHNRVRGLHPADLAFILEALPREQRLLVWTQLPAPRAAQVLVEVSPAVRQTLLEGMERAALLETLRAMDPEDLAYVADSVEEDVRREVYAGLDAASMSWLRGSQSWPEGSVGQLMTQELVALREGGTLDDALQAVRTREALPPQTDALCVVDGRNVLKGVLPVEALLVRPGGTAVGNALRAEAVTFAPQDDAGQAAKAFERYDLVSAPVVDERGKLVGRLTVDAVMDFVRRRAEVEALRRAGLAGEEDLFAPVGASARNRWLWLGVNVFTAFTASRVIGLFDETIARTLALATLMPVVASVGGNTGNQTVALMIRGLALGQLTAGRHPPPVPEGAGRGAAQRSPLGRPDGPGHAAPLPDACAGPGDGGGRGAEPGGGRGDGSGRAPLAAPRGAGSGPGRQRAAHVHHGRHGVLHLPGVGQGVPVVERPLSGPWSGPGRSPRR